MNLDDNNATAIDDAAHLQAVLNTVLDGLITIDDAGLVKSFNPAATRIFGYRPEEVIGRNVKMLMPEPYHREHDGYLSNYLATGAAKVIGIGREVSAMRKDGSVFPMELGINEMRVNGKRMFVGTIRDISARKLAEQRLQQAMADLQFSNAELETFTYIVSHDLRSPLVNLKGFSAELQRSINSMLPMLRKTGESLSENEQNLLKKEVEERIPKSLRFIANAAEKMDRLTDAILQLSRLGRREMLLEEIDTSSLAQHCIEALEHQIEETKTKIILGDLPVIVADKVSMEQVFGNLLDNAIKYLMPGRPGEISISAKQDRERVTFAVADNGRGIAKDDMHKVFEAFRRAGDVEHIHGEGMGMPFVRAILKRHQGAIWCESELGKGTIFYFTIDANLKPERIPHAA